MLNDARKFSLTVSDDYFAKKELVFNGFKWGSGKKKLLITHGWGSKAADFADLIVALKEIDNLEIIAFDAPGNGSSEGDLSNLLLYILAIKAITREFGKTDILIGHSLGAMANVIALSDIDYAPSLLISMAPLVRLKENFEDSMLAVGVPQTAQDNFLKSFEEKFGKPVSHYNLMDWYPADVPYKHFLMYDQNDLISTYNYLKEFLETYPSIQSRSYEGVGHDRIIKSVQVIADLVNVVKTNLN